jgi:hypothetical protein
MASGQDLNSLSRFRKQSGRLVLEEHSHCEVPAGCGGVVLRWRNPFAAVPLTIRLYTPVPAACFLDGAEVLTGRVDLAPGRHAMALALENADLSVGLLLFAAVHPGTTTERPAPGEVIETPVGVLTADDGTWKCTLDGPVSDEWKAPAFDDHAWVALKRRPTPRLATGAPGAYQCDECVRQGAVCLGLPKPGRAGVPASWWQRLLGREAAHPPATGRVWIRKIFDIPPPQLRAPS